MFKSNSFLCRSIWKLDLYHCSATNGRLSSFNNLAQFCRNLTGSTSTCESDNTRADVAILGGGIIGMSVAYFLKSKIPDADICLVERDPTYAFASTTLSAGGIRQQWEHSENIRMSMFTAAFIQRDAKQALAVPNQKSDESLDFGYHSQGYLTLCDRENAPKMAKNYELQRELGAKIELYSAQQIKQKFPYINTSGVECATFGVRNEGWLDPWSLLSAFKRKAKQLGVRFLHADVIDFDLRQAVTEDGERYDTCNSVTVRHKPSDKMGQLSFSRAAFCFGANSGKMAHKLGYGVKDGCRSIALPVEPRKRFIYVIHCRDSSLRNFPFLIDFCGEYCRPEGAGGNFICGRSPTDSEPEPDPSDLEVDYDYFNNSIHPLLASRVPAFESLKLRNAWAGYYDYCRFDQNPIIGPDPYFDNIVWATGFSGHGLQMAPAVGRAIAEWLQNSAYTTIDLSVFGWQRLLRNEPLASDNCV